MEKTKILNLSYNAMFKAVFSNNKAILAKLIEAILEYCKMNIDIKGKEIIIKNNELPISNYKDKQLICDYIIKLNETTDLNIEINRSYYPGLIERNMTYSFKIYYQHFNAGDDYKEFEKYNLIQVNFNNFNNHNTKSINVYYLIDLNDINNILSKNIRIINIDIENCYNLVYNNSKKEEITELEKLSAIMHCEYLEDISSILESVGLDMDNKKKFINDVLEASNDKDVQKAVKLEDSIDYRFELVEEEALKRGIEQGIEQGTKETKRDMIKEMLKQKLDYELISKVSGKSINEIKEIEKSINID